MKDPQDDSTFLWWWGMTSLVMLIGMIPFLLFAYWLQHLH